MRFSLPYHTVNKPTKRHEPNEIDQNRLLRATALIGDALGHSWVGLLLLRAMDYRLQTPVPLAYAYKTMMFFVPASGGKNAIVMGKQRGGTAWLMDRGGEEGREGGGRGG